ncbi:MAG: hypothetical protein LCH67_10590 [Bacteroidetes bacterium]|nr:hypothetical protein [Bacteroidota bacterium]
MKRILVVFCILFLQKGFAQSIVYYPFNSLLGVSSNPQNKVWVDVKMQTNSYFSSLSTEISPEITFKKTNRALYYVGGGLKLNYLNAIDNNNILEGFMLNTGVRIMPVDKFKRFQVAFEVSPYVTRKMDIGLMRTFLGIGYNFSGKK